MSLLSLNANHARVIAGKVLLALMCLVMSMNGSVKRQVDSVRRQVEYDQKLFSDIVFKKTGADI